MNLLVVCSVIQKQRNVQIKVDVSTQSANLGITKTGYYCYSKYNDDMKRDDNVHSDGRDELFLGL